MTMSIQQILEIWAKTHRAADDNPGLMIKAAGAEVKPIHDLCAARMTCIRAADELLLTLKNQPWPLALPALLVDYFAAQDDPGCSRCWMSSRAKKEHDECEEKIKKYFDAKNKLIAAYSTKA